MARAARDGGTRAAVGLGRTASHGSRIALRGADIAAREVGSFVRIVLGRMVGAVLGAVRRDPGAALRRVAPVAVALAVIGGATGQGERHAAPWFDAPAARVSAVADDAPAARPGSEPMEIAATDGAPDDAAGGRADPVVFGLQAELADLGFYEGAIDGVAGSRTRAAIRAWQASRGLPQTGIADETVLARMRAGASDVPRARSTAANDVPRPLPVTRPSAGPATDPVATGSLEPNAVPSEAPDGAADAEELALDIQRGLVAWGADIAVDGVIGPQTRAVMADYRGANGLAPGTDADLVAHMREGGLIP